MPRFANYADSHENKADVDAAAAHGNQILLLMFAADTALIPSLLLLLIAALLLSNHTLSLTLPTDTLTLWLTLSD
jgi:hypothetical protein